jgi:hypothetical protein
LTQNEGLAKKQQLNIYSTVLNICGERRLPLMAIRSVYMVANDMDLIQAFYAGARELPLAFQDHDNWRQFNVGQLSLALSSPSEAAQGAQGSVVVFEATDVAPIAQRIERLADGSCRAATWARAAASRRSPT